MNRKSFAGLTLSIFVALMAFAEDGHAVMQVTGFVDVDFTNVSPRRNRVQQRMRLCVTSDPAGPYRITAFGSGPSSAFSIINGAGITIDYDVRVRGGVGAGRRNTLQPGVPRTGFTARPPRVNGGCRGNSRVALIVSLDRQDLEQAPGGQYFGNLSVTVSPE